MIKTNTIDTNSKETEETNSLVEDNWLDLASHFQTKVNKRTSEVSFLHTKAGFLITAAAVLLQVIVSLPKPTGYLAIVCLYCVNDSFFFINTHIHSIDEYGQGVFTIRPR